MPVYDVDRRPDGTTFFTMRRVLRADVARDPRKICAGVILPRVPDTQRELLTRVRDDLPDDRLRTRAA
ncbi:MAG: hypothetical protein IPQ07_35865 [Myxococcales bacterium]|nr:hypothetical protein [Myxococcales bacterium]